VSSEDAWAAAKSFQFDQGEGSARLYATFLPILADSSGPLVCRTSTPRAAADLLYALLWRSAELYPSPSALTVNDVQGDCVGPRVAGRARELAGVTQLGLLDHQGALQLPSATFGHLGEYGVN